MKTAIIIAFLTLIIVKSTFSQIRLEENFNYLTGDSIGAHGWNVNSGGSTNRILVTSPGLAYSGYPMSGIGNAATLNDNGQDQYKGFVASDSSGTVYMSFIVNITSAQRPGDYFISFLPSNSTTFYSGRVHVRLVNGSVEFGLTKSSVADSNSMVWSGGYSLGISYLLIVKYSFVTGANNDDVSMFIFNASIPLTEPAPTIGPLTFLSADVNNIGRVALRQGTIGRAPNVIVDGIRVSKSWVSILDSIDAGIKFYEHFSFDDFPSEGWSIANLVSGSSEWGVTSYNVRTLPGAAISGSSILGTNNYLVSERFTPYSGDSLVFYFRQSSATVYPDSLDVRISTTDSLVTSFTNRLILLKDGDSYPSAGTYAKFGVSLSGYTGQNCWIAFHRSSSGLDTVMLDDVRVGTPPANFVRVEEVLEPMETVDNEEFPLAPRAIIINEGTSDQLTPFAITCNITGPINYSSIRYDTLASGLSKVIVFDSTFSPIDTGDYDLKMDTNVGDTLDANSGETTDGNGNINVVFKKKGWLKKLFNGVIKSIFRRQGFQNQDNGCNYWWHSSISPNTSKRPSFYWKPTNSPQEVDLIINGQNVTGYPFTGDMDNGYFKIQNILTAGKCVRLCDEARKTFWISTNGIVGFGESIPENISNKRPSRKNVVHPALMALWMDLDFNLIPDYSTNRLSYRVKNYTDGTSRLIITYYKVRVNSPGGNNPNEFVSFQICIELLNENAGRNSNFRYSFADAEGDQKTGQDFMDNYRHLWFGDLNDHIVGIGTSDNRTDKALYRVRVSPGTTIKRVRKTGPLYGGSPWPNTKEELAVEFATYDNDCKKCDYSTEDTIGVPPCDPSNFRVLKQGYYSGGSHSKRDTLIVHLRNSASPYAIVDTVKAFSDSLGNLVCRFCDIIPNGNYYVVIKSRNSIETWSAAPVAFVNSVANYDFTTASTKAFGNNMIQVGSKWCVYSGDTDQDGVVDASDISVIDNDASNFVTGYVATDLNGDGTVDGTDAIIADNNAANFVSVIRP